MKRRDVHFVHLSKSKEILSVILCLVIFAAVSMATLLFAFIQKNREPEPSRYSLSENAAFDLTNLDNVVISIREALVERSSAIHIRIKLKGEYMDDISPFVNELMSLAYLPTEDPREGDYLRFQMGGYTFSYGHEETAGGYIYSISIRPEYYSDPEQEKATDLAVAEIISELGLADNATEFEKICAVYNYLSENVKYDLIHRNNAGYHLKSTAYGALVNHAACCQGYSTAMYRLLKELGVESRIIIGEGITEEGSELHSWNIVRIGEYYYNVDPTWNSSYTEIDYFLKSDEEFPDHIRDEEYLSEEFISEHVMAVESYPK